MTILNDPETFFIPVWLEGFLYGLYSGIFVMHLQCPGPLASKKSRTATILFYAVCLLYVLSTATFVSDLVAIILEIRIGTLSPRLQIDLQSIIFYISIIQTTANGCCDFLAQCILIYRCWIVWGKNIRVVIIPSILAIAYLATWLGQLGASIFVQGEFAIAGWGVLMDLTGLVASMAVNALVTGLIVFKILMVFKSLGVNLNLKGTMPVTSVQRTLGSTTGGTKLRHIIFVIIESGMALLTIQLIRLVFFILPKEWTLVGDNYVIVINEMFNGIAPTIILVRVSMRLSFDDTESFKEAAGGLRFNNPPSDPNASTSTGSMPPQLGYQGQEKNKDMIF